VEIRYNIPKWDGPRPITASPPSVSVDEARARSCGGRRAAFGVISAVLHAAALGTLVMVVSPPSPPAALDEATVEMVFEQPGTPPGPTAEAEPPKVDVPPVTPPEAPVPPPEPEPPPPPATVPTPKLAAPKPRPKLVSSPRPVTTQPAERPTPPAMAAPAAVATAVPAIDSGWLAAMSSSLAARKVYPEEARRRGEEGRVTVRFTVDRSGHVTEAAIVSSSGSALLDEAASGLLRQAVLPPFPAGMTEARITITTTMRYSLR
jgi:protein TonB